MRENERKRNERKRTYERQESMCKKEKGVKKSICEKEKNSACDGRVGAMFIDLLKKYEYAAK